MLSLYVHIPFCVDRCTYCDFYSTRYDEHRVQPYLDALFRELKERASGRRVDTVFIGGGTPTSIPPALLNQLLETVRDTIELTSEYEWTVEANPGTLTKENADILVANGVNRISMGAQTFHEDHLRAMRRIHSPQQVVESVTVAREAGLKDVSIDLIFGWPGATVDMLEYDLDQAAELDISHLSAYALTIEEGTPLHRMMEKGLVHPVDDDVYADMYETLLSRTHDMGLDQYEISNFAKPEFECRHNLAYWNYTDYIGLGVSAWSFEKGRRFGNIRDEKEYVARMNSGSDTIDESEELSGSDRDGEIIIMKLRTLEGISRGWWTSQSTTPLDSIANRLQSHIDSGRVVWNGERLCLTRSGLFVSNAILRDCIGAAGEEAHA